jgi:hypothetical protein
MTPSASAPAKARTRNADASKPLRTEHNEASALPPPPAYYHAAASLIRGELSRTHTGLGPRDADPLSLQPHAASALHALWYGLLVVLMVAARGMGAIARSGVVAARGYATTQPRAPKRCAARKHAMRPPTPALRAIGVSVRSCAVLRPHRAPTVPLPIRALLQARTAIGRSGRRAASAADGQSRLQAARRRRTRAALDGCRRGGSARRAHCARGSCRA